MKLYYSPITCSLSPYIALLESGLPFELVNVDLPCRTARTITGSTRLATCRCWSWTMAAVWPKASPFCSASLTESPQV